MAFETRLTDIYGHPIDRHLTAEQFFDLSPRLPRIAQLIDGEVVVDSPSVRHQHVVVELVLQFRQWAEAGPGRGQCGIQVDVQLDHRNVYEPDLWWFREERKPGLDGVRLPMLPDIAVEVLSPSNRRFDLGIKRAMYEQLGLPELWIIDPVGMAATIWRRSAADGPSFDVAVKLEWDGSLESPLLPGFAVRVGQLSG